MEQEKLNTKKTPLLPKEGCRFGGVVLSYPAHLEFRITK